MRFFGLLVPIVCGLLCVAADPQQINDGRNGPHVHGTPGHQVYIRGQNDGVYKVPGVGGQFQHSSSPAEHVYTDEQGNTYVHRKKAGRPGTHTIRGPGPVAAQPIYPAAQDSPYGPAVSGHRISRSPQFHVERPGRTVDVGQGGFDIQRSRRSPQFQGERPGRTVDVGNGGFVIQRSSRSVNDGRVQGENFVARDDQAGVWDENVSVWRRPDGRTVTVGADGSTIISGHGKTLYY
ncbi:baramicin A1 isoform X2 [Drosophila gunungcola]|uniref:Immune-induced peptides n=1 Tax=Drosophila gunungcola TaxID=103775 RepID=A0A9Q0BKD5_9MUSC|nr:baramicin A1 isoform X2 [Drosophila gunungcola]KAI8035732.1 hypothetical protein M5D96_011482 [Drosophila gunungcola]